MNTAEDGLPLPARYWAILNLAVGMALSVLDSAITNIALMLRGKIPINLNYSASQPVIDAAVDQTGIRHVVVSRKLMEKVKLTPKGTLIALEEMPAKVGKLLYETATHHNLPESRIGLTTNVMHWGYGKQWGLVLGVAVGCGSRLRIWQAPLLGLLVWLASYISLPIAGFYQPLWSYDLKTLWDDLSAHLVYGAATAAAFWAANRS